MQDIFEEIYQKTQSGLPPRGGAGGKGARAGHDFIRPPGAAAELFSADQIALFQKRSAVFLRRSFPAFAATLSDAELEKLALYAQKRAALRGFSTEKQIWHYLIAAVYCGFFFEQDAQYADMLALIGWHEPQADKTLLLENLLDIIDEYALECEKDFADFDKKLRYIGAFYTNPQFGGAVLARLSAPELAALAEKMLETVFPARARLWSAPRRQQLIAANLEHAARIGFSAKEALFYLPAAVYFGCGFEQSPLYPWAYFLQNRALPAAERAKHFIGLAQRHFCQLTAA